jgi:hypothetical protein
MKLRVGSLAKTRKLASQPTETMPGLLMETLLPAVPLVVFGAGPDAAPLVVLACRRSTRAVQDAMRG